MTPAKQVVILKIEHYIENSNFYIMVSSYHNYLNLHIRCLVDALVRLQTQYGSWTPKNGDLPPKYVLVLKTLFYGTILEGVKMVCEIFSGCPTPGCGMCCVCSPYHSNACKICRPNSPKWRFATQIPVRAENAILRVLFFMRRKWLGKFFMDVPHPIVVCIVFTDHVTRMHAKSADQTPPNDDLPPKYVIERNHKIT